MGKGAPWRMVCGEPRKEVSIASQRFHAKGYQENDKTVYQNANCLQTGAAREGYV